MFGFPRTLHFELDVFKSTGLINEVSDHIYFGGTCANPPALLYIVY